MKFEIEDKDVNKLLDAITNYQGNAEQVITEYLSNEANDIFKPSIISLVPRSDRIKPHAKDRDPFIGEMVDSLTLYIHSKKPYHYLYFPDQGQGTSKNQLPHDFMEGGVDKEYNTVVNGLLDALINNWETNL